MIGNEQNGDLENWDGFLGSNFLQAKDVEKDDVFVCIGIEFDAENERPMLILEKDKKKYKFSLNVTNSNFCRDAGMESPKNMVGKKIYFRKTMAFSPSAKKDVETLRIDEIE